MRFLARSVIITGLILLASQTARATTLIQTYSDLTSWQAAVAELGMDTFEGKVSSGGNTGSSLSNAAGYVDAESVTFTGLYGVTYSLEIIDALSAPQPYYNFGSGASLTSGSSTTTSPPSIVAKLPAGITAISLDVMTYGNNVPVTLTASDGTTDVVSTAFRTQTFVGFTFSAPISSLTLSIPGAPQFTSVLLDNFAIGTADMGDPVPEPVTLLLVGMGLLMMALVGRTGPRLLP